MLGHAWTCMESLPLPTDCQKESGTNLCNRCKWTGPTNVAGGRWHVAGAYIADVICHAAPFLSLSLSRSLAVCSALSKHVTGMPRLRDVSPCVCGREQEAATHGMKRNEMEWTGLDWTGLGTDCTE